ncbi:hypothetical protein ACFQ77_06740 [Streptomyces virginiae]|uniref:hypothetical protein n=1 Tax=Streptomyces virginiae TaxID=1961 RepID=UPI00369B0EF9
MSSIQKRRRIPTCIGASCLAAALAFSTGATIATAAVQAPAVAAEEDPDTSNSDTGSQQDSSHPQGTDTGDQQDASHPQGTDTGDQTGGRDPQGTDIRDQTGGRDPQNLVDRPHVKTNSHPPDVVAPPQGNDYVGIGGSHQDTDFNGTRSPAATGTVPQYHEETADLRMVLDFINSYCRNAGSLKVLPVPLFDCLVDTASQFVNGWYPKDATDRLVQKYVRFIVEAPVNPKADKSIDCSKYSGSTKLPDECFVGSSEQR